MNINFNDIVQTAIVLLNPCNYVIATKNISMVMYIVSMQDLVPITMKNIVWND